MKLFSTGVSLWAAWEQGVGGGEKKGKRKREGKGEPAGIHRYFKCSSFIIYAGPSINYSNTRNNKPVWPKRELLKTRISSSLWMHQTRKLVAIHGQFSFQL